jgi:hypothetical protein
MRAETGDFDPSLVRGGSLAIPTGRRRATGKSGARELAQEKGNPIWGFGWRGGLTGVARSGGELGRSWSSGGVADRRSPVSFFGLGRFTKSQRSLRGEGLAGG